MAMGKRRKTAEQALFVAVSEIKGGGVPRSRNEMMANAMVVRRLTAGRGRGWLVMRRTMRQFNGTEATLENDPVSRVVRVTFPFASAAEPGGRGPEGRADCAPPIHGHR